MKYLKIFENFDDNRDKLISDLETISHILQDENHQVSIKKSEESSILYINISIGDLQEIKNTVIDEYESMIHGEIPENEDYSELEIDEEVIERIMEKDEMVEYDERLHDMCTKYKYKYDILYLNEGVTFYLSTDAAHGLL